jgi:hypothetical protein
MEANSITKYLKSKEIYFGETFIFGLMNIY